METINYKNYRIEIKHCEPFESPRNWDDLTKMFLFCKSYTLGDSHNLTVEEVNRNIVNSNKFICLPVYGYIHGGITISTEPFSCRFDSGQLGYIAVSKSDARKYFNVKRLSKKLIERINNIMLAEIETYDIYLRGEIYRYECYDSEDNSIDSCCEFYGYDHEKSGLMESAKTAIDSDIASKQKIKSAKLKQYIQNNVPLLYRDLTV